MVLLVRKAPCAWGLATITDEMIVMAWGNLKHTNANCTKNAISYKPCTMGISLHDTSNHRTFYTIEAYFIIRRGEGILGLPAQFYVRKVPMLPSPKIYDLPEILLPYQDTRSCIYVADVRKVTALFAKISAPLYDLPEIPPLPHQTGRISSRCEKGDYAPFTKYPPLYITCQESLLPPSN